MSTLSVVIPTLQRAEHIRALLLELNKQTMLPTEVIVVDGAPPTDKSAEIAFREVEKKLAYDCVYIRSARGAAQQRNVGAAWSKSNICLFMDDDIRPNAEFIEAIV